MADDICRDIADRSAGEAPYQESLFLPGVVESVIRCHDNGRLIALAAQLWIRPGDHVLDVTYGRGGFWTRYRPAHLTIHDLELDGVDFRQLPEADSSVDVVVFDPPYIAPGGRTTSTIPDFLDRYGIDDCPRTVRELSELVAAGLKETARVLRPRGRLLVKCMDYISGGRFVTGRHHVVSTALDLGLDQVDELVHYSRPGPQPPGRRQLHSRRAHSFLCVFELPQRRLGRR
jgi:hypothetical protein